MPYLYNNNLDSFVPDPCVGHHVRHFVISGTIYEITDIENKVAYLKIIDGKDLFEKRYGKVYSISYSLNELNFISNGNEQIQMFII